MRRDSAIRSVAAMPECLLLILSCLIARPIRSQTLEYEQFIPPVVRFDRDQPVVLQVKVLGSVTRVVLEGVLSQPLEMRDDGSGGDQTAGDGIYTIQIQASQILSITKPDDFSRPFLGYATLYQGNTSIGRYNIFPEILTQNMPAVQVSALAQDVQSSPYVVNIHDPAYFTTFDHARITKRFYQFFPDDYDFINIIRLPSYFQNRHYMGVKNSDQGIGVTLFDGTSYYGSSGRLQGILVFPIPGYFDGAETGYQHELGHRWINFLDVAPLASGRPHWPLSSLATGMMGMNIPGTGVGGRFPCRLVPEQGGVRMILFGEEPVFTDLDLYLMGLMPPESVGEHIVFADQTLAQSLGCGGPLFTGEVIRVKVDDIVKAVGPRIPDWRTAQKSFRMATIIVSRDGLLGDDAMSFYTWFARRAEDTRTVNFASGFVKSTAKPFAVSTGGRGSIDAQVYRSPDRTEIKVPVPNGGANAASTVGRVGSTRTGYAVVSADAAPYGTAVFSYSQNGIVVSEAGVPASPPTTSARVYIDYRPGGAAQGNPVRVNTGIALVNRGTATAQFTCTLYDLSAKIRAAGHGTVAPGAHHALFVDQLSSLAPDFRLPDDFAAARFGMLEIGSDQALSILALRQTTNQRDEVLFTTTPTVDLASAPAVTPVYFPQFADGGGYLTEFILLGARGAAEATLKFYGGTGTPLAVGR